MDWLYNIVKGIASFCIDNWATAIKLVIAAYFITTGMSLLAGANMPMALPGFSLTLPM